jgi:hypothetical protein
VKVHPLMFYDLQRPAAGAYGNDTYEDLLRFSLSQQRIRRIVHYPEASWWLTFDVAVPLFLAPATLEARQWDLRLLAPHLSRDERARTGVWGHRLFSSGQEWGYWLVDYCVSKMVWDLSVTHDVCLDDFARTFAHGDTLRAVLRAVEARQVADLRDPEIVRFLVGSDDEVETAARVGITFHPLPPPPAEVATWADDEVASLHARSLQPLREIVRAYHAFADRVEATLPAQTPAQAPWVRELRDGLRMFALRAAHAIAIYEGALLVREGQAGRAPADLAAAALSGARALTREARAIVRRRERDHRYPTALTTAGDEKGAPGAVRNRTIYPHRYLSRTHRLYYWTRPDEQLADLIRRGRTRQGRAPVADKALVFPRGSLRVEAPEGARRIEGLLPGLAAVLGDDGAPYLELSALGADAGDAEPWRCERQGNRTATADLAFTLPRIGDLVLRDAVVEVVVPAPDTPGEPRLRIVGDLITNDLVGLVVRAGGFDAAGARLAIGLALGHGPGRLPERIPLSLSARGK